VTGLDSDSFDGETRRRLLDITAFLQEIASTPEILNGLAGEEKSQLLNAAGDVFCPDPEVRRRRTKVLRN
jgi:hypothetical protein